jgi:FGGY-family pentulose kinase
MGNRVQSEPLVMGIDAGTEALKAGLFDLTGTLIKSASRPYKTSFPRPGWAEQSPAAWWDALVGAIRDCLAAEPWVDPARIAGISADATCCTMIPLDQSGRELRDCLLWMDVRAAEQARRIFEGGHAALRYCLAGVNAEWMPPKMLWLKENEPEIWAQTATLIEFTDWIAFKLTGRLTLNISTTSHRWFYHTPSGGWQEEFFAAIGLEGLRERFPSEVLAIGEVVGPLAPDVASLTGLPAGIPVAAGGADAFIGILGQGITQPGDMGVITGTSNVMAALSANEVHFPGIFGSFPDALIPGLNLIEGGQVTTGAILAWFARQFARDLLGPQGEITAETFSRLRQEASSQRRPSGLILLDAFQGNRTPHTDSRARGALWGLSLNTTRGDVWNAIMEGVAFGMFEILTVFAENHFDVDRLVFSGGATRSAEFMQIYADVLGRPIFTTEQTEACLLGSGLVAAVGAGLFPNLDAAAQAMVQVTGPLEPDAAMHDQYREVFTQYRRTYPALKEPMHAMAAYLAR